MSGFRWQPFHDPYEPGDRYRYSHGLARWLLVVTSGSVEWHRYSAEYLVSFEILLDASVFIWVREDGERRREVARGLIERRSRTTMAMHNWTPQLPQELFMKLQIFTVERFDAMVEEINRIQQRGKRRDEDRQP